MNADQVKKIIESSLTDVVVNTSGEGCNFTVTIVGDCFNGLNPVKRQQLVYGCLNEYIADGSIHALTIKTYTPSQWQQLS